MGNDFDRWLEDELNRSLSAVDGGYQAPRYLDTRAPRRGRVLAVLAGAPALISAKVAAAGIVLVAATTTGVAIHSAAAGNTANDPGTWGQQVVQQVQKCKAALGADQHGIGKCVSQFAKQHGDQQSDQNGQGAGNDQDGSGDDGNGNGHGHGKPSGVPTPQGKGGASGDHPTPPASAPTPPSHPTGAPASVPTPPAHPTGRP
jgi:hypothetical protein